MASHLKNIDAKYEVKSSDFKSLSKKTLEGGHGKVTFVEQISNGEKCVLKQTSNMKDIQFEREVEALATIQHPAIVPFVGYCIVTEKRRKKGNIYLKAIEKGSLEDNIENSRKDKPDQLWDDTHKLIIAYGIACAMEYIHSKGVVHRDLKTDNILLDAELQPYVTDFGTARAMDADFSVSHTVQETTVSIMAPEFFNSFVDFNRTPEIDVYSYAMILYSLFTEKKPYGDNPIVTEVVERTTQGLRPEFEPEGPPSQVWIDLIQKCWAQEPSDRPTFTDICNYLETNAFHTDKIDYSLFEAYKKKTRKPLGIPNSLPPKAVPITTELAQPIKLADQLSKSGTNIKDEANNASELKIAADKGDSNAQNLYALCLYNGFNVIQNQQEASKYFELSANNGNYEAMLWYSLILNKQGKKDQSSHYYEQSVSSGQVPECWSIYAQQQIEQGNSSAAMDYLPQAIQYGSMSAMLAYANLNGDDPEIQDNFFEMASNCCHCLDKAGTYFPIDYKVYHCLDCNLDMCEGCAKHCHKNCRTQEIGLRECFVCGCGKNHFQDKKNTKKCSVEYAGQMVADGQPCCYQHFYQCKTCTPMLDGKFICSSCIEACHKGHNIVDCGVQKGFCHCGTKQLGPSCSCKLLYYVDKTPEDQCTNKNNASTFQRFYQCMTCGLYGSSNIGVCQNCAKHCHKGHILLDRGVKKNTCQCREYDKCSLKK